MGCEAYALHQLHATTGTAVMCSVRHKHAFHMMKVISR
jgi:hypothetical protein